MKYAMASKGNACTTCKLSLCWRRLVPQLNEKPYDYLEANDQWVVRMELVFRHNLKSNEVKKYLKSSR